MTVCTQVLQEVLQRLEIPFVFVAAYGLKLNIGVFKDIVGQYAEPWSMSWKSTLLSHITSDLLEEVNENIVHMASNIFQVGKTIYTNDACAYLFGYAGSQRLGVQRKLYPLMGTFGMRTSSDAAKFGGISFKYTSSTEDIDVAENGITKRIIYPGPLVRMLRSLNGSNPPPIPSNHKANKEIFQKQGRLFNRLVKQFQLNPNSYAGYRLEIEYCGTDLSNTRLYDDISLANFSRQHDLFIFGLKVPLEHYLATIRSLLQQGLLEDVTIGRNHERPTEAKKKLVSTIVAQIGWSSKHGPDYSCALYEAIAKNKNCMTRVVREFNASPFFPTGDPAVPEQTSTSLSNSDSATIRNLDLEPSRILDPAGQRNPDPVARIPPEILEEITDCVCFRKHTKSKPDNPLWTFTRLKPPGTMGFTASRIEELADMIFHVYGPNYKKFVRTR